MKRCDRCGIPTRQVSPVAVGGPADELGRLTFRTVCPECAAAVRRAYVRASLAVTENTE